MANPVLDTLGNTITFDGGNALNGLLMLGGAVVAIAILGFLSWSVTKWFLETRKYVIPVEILFRPTGYNGIIKKTDKAGIFLKKGINLKRLWLKNEKIGLNPDNVPFIFNTKGQRIITLQQTGLRDFRYVNINIHDNPGLKYTVGDEDVNWALAAFQEWKVKFNVKSFFEQYGHMVLWMMTILGTLMLMYFLFQKFDVINSVASSLNSAAQTIKDANIGTVIE